jgi:hypothetical protein
MQLGMALNVCATTLNALLHYLLRRCKFTSSHALTLNPWPHSGTDLNVTMAQVITEPP